MRASPGADFETFAGSHWRGFVGTAFGVTGDWQAAQDATQSAMVALYVRWSRLSDQVDRLSYARRAVINAALDILRERDRRGKLWRRLAASSTSSTWAVTDAVESTDQHRLLDRLPPRQRAVVVLRFLEDLSVQETATILGVSPGTVKSQSADALAALRRQIASEEYHER